MSMSEFEGQLNERGDISSSLSTQGHELPPDFDEEDRAFVEELDALFAISDEELPPYFVQTLLEPDELRYQPVEPGFEQKITACVFRRLKMPRRLFYRSHLSFPTVFSAVRIRHSLLITTAAVMLIMFLTMLFTAPSFASGMALLLRGGHTGVYQVKTYPRGVHTSPAQNNEATQPKRVTLLTAQQMLHFSMYLPNSTPANYSLSNIYLYEESDQSWADGPTMEFDYYLSPGIPVKGTGEIAIREFKLQPKASVYQVVGFGAARAVNTDQAGQSQAIYIDGQWVMRNRFSPVWVFGGRSELIYQRNGIVFWIVGDQRDGIGLDALMNIATSLQVFNVNQAMHTVDYLNIVTLLPRDNSGLFTGDVLAVVPDDSVDGSYLRLVGSDFPLPKKQMPQKSMTHS